MFESLDLRLKKDSWACRISEAFPSRSLELVTFQPAGRLHNTNDKNANRWIAVLKTSADDESAVFTNWIQSQSELEKTTLLRCEQKTCKQNCNRKDGCTIAFTCPEPLFGELLTEYGILLKMPIVLEHGVMHMKILSTSENISKFYEQLHMLAGKEVHITSKHKQESIETVTLTEKQKQLIRIAREMGYYNVPRTITTTELAKRLGISQSTLGEHLRKAEKNIIDCYTV